MEVSTVRRRFPTPLLLPALLAGAASDQEAERFDLVVRGGRVVDGTGNPWIRAAVGAHGDRIADLAVLDPARIVDRATFAEPHQYAEGVEYVLMNGVPVVDGGEHTSARPGRVLCGPGRR